MIVVMKADATREQIDHMTAHVASLGMTPQVIRGAHQTVIAAIGEECEGLAEALEPGDGVEKVLPIMAPYKRASSELKSERTVVQARGLSVGGLKVAVIAGPCSVESEEQIVSLAKKLKTLGATGLRGGAFKPRTSPYSFQGHKEEGLRMLAAAREATGLAIVTEVMAPEHVPLVAEYADVLQIGAAEYAELSTSPSRRRFGQAGVAQARHQRDDRRVLARGRIYSRSRQSARDALRARHSHL